MFRSLCLETDRAAMAGVSEYEDRGVYVVTRTPSEPDYWYGNALTFRDGRVDIPAQTALFREVFPGASHILLQWDVPDMDPAPLREALKGTGMSLDAVEVLSRVGPPQGAPLPGGLEIRRLGGDADWRAVADLQFEVGLEDAADPGKYRAFVDARFATKRRQMEAGLGARFAVWDGDRPVADMGVVLMDDLVRYQDVATRASHRRRGLCAALLAHAGGWAEAQRPGATQVIVADADSAGGRVYKRAGFALAETVLAAIKRGT